MDQNCDGVDGEDLDGDGHLSIRSGGDDCDDSNAARHPGAPEIEQWELSTVVAAGADPRFASVAAQAEGVAHVAFRYGGEHEGGVLGYATNASGEWVPTTIGEGPEDGYGTSIVLDAAGNVHIASFDRDAQKLSYATNVGGDWASGPIDDGLSRLTGLNPTILVGPGGSLAVGHCGTGVFLTTIRGDDADTEIVDAYGALAGMWGCSLAWDRAGAPHMTYGASDGLTHAWRGADWDYEALFDCDLASCKTALAIGAEGRVHVAFTRPRDAVGREEIILGTSSEDGVSEENFGTGIDPSLAISNEAVLHLAWVDEEALRLASGSPGNWTTEIVADDLPSAGIAGGVALALSANLVHLAYGRYDSIEYARRSPPNGADDDCDGAPW